MLCQILNTEAKTTAETPRNSIIVRHKETDRLQPASVEMFVKSISRLCVCRRWWSCIILKVKCFTSQYNINISRVHLHPLIVSIIVSDIKILGWQQWVTNASVEHKEMDIFLCFLGNTVTPFCTLFRLSLATKADLPDFGLALVRVLFFPAACWHSTPQCCQPWPSGTGELRTLVTAQHKLGLFGGDQNNTLAVSTEVVEVSFCYSWKSSFRESNDNKKKREIFAQGINE